MLLFHRVTFLFCRKGDIITLRLHYKIFLDANSERFHSFKLQAIG